MEVRSAKKLTKLSEEEADDDRISHIPDELLLHILSFIPTVFSVATCMVSKRWRHLWKHVPKLTFDDTLNHQTQSDNVRFAKFVNNVLIWHVPVVLEKLSLSLYQNRAIYDVGNWIAKSITRNIQSFDLTMHNDSPTAPAVRLPSSLFTCKTLEALVLRGREGKILVDVPRVVCLPKLKTVKLLGLKYQDDRDCLGRLISSCPSLESLVVEDETRVNDYIGFDTISSTTLRDIEFRFCKPPCLIGYNPTILCSALRRLSLIFPQYPCKDITVPSNVFSCKTLEQLVLKGVTVTCSSRIICLPNLTFLVLHEVELEDDEFFSRLISGCTSLKSLVVAKWMKADLNISSGTLNDIKLSLCCKTKPGHKLVINAPALKYLKLNNYGYVDYHIEDLASLEQAHIRIGLLWDMSYQYCSSALTNAYQALGHVKSLIIDKSHVNVGVDHDLPMFNRLTELEITFSTWVGYCFFQKLIMNSTKLEKITFGRNFAGLYDHLPAACLLLSLKCVSISIFKGQEDELAMIHYILGNAKIMEKMEVCFFWIRSKELKSEMREKILSVRPLSEKCEVVLTEDRRYKY